MGTSWNDTRSEDIGRKFWARVGAGGDGCWPWQGVITVYGYGVLLVGSKVRGTRRRLMAHRVSYELLVGPIPDGLQIDHLCRNRACVRPDHLEPVTNRENQLRGQGPVGEQMRRDHCINGHPFNHVYVSDGRFRQRRCTVCDNESRRRRRAIARGLDPARAGSPGSPAPVRDRLEERPGGPLKAAARPSKFSRQRNGRRRMSDAVPRRRKDGTP